MAPAAVTLILHTDVATHAAGIKVLRSALEVIFCVFLSAGTPEEEEEGGGRKRGGEEEGGRGGG